MIKDKLKGTIAFLDVVQERGKQNRVVLALANVLVWGAVIHFSAVAVS